jgi:hypothetical protein
MVRVWAEPPKSAEGLVRKERYPACQADGEPAASRRRNMRRPSVGVGDFRALSSVSRHELNYGITPDRFKQLLGDTERAPAAAPDIARLREMACRTAVYAELRPGAPLRYCRARPA